jgi:hypothetical protein
MGEGLVVTGLTRCDSSFNQGNLQVRTSLSKRIGGTESAAACADDDDVGLGVFVQVGEVCAGHGAGDLALAGERGELESVPLDINQVGLSSLSLQRVSRQIHGRRFGECRSGRRHCWCFEGTPASVG